jgi:outer membrane receptor protein involved in Fe transport
LAVQSLEAQATLNPLWNLAVDLGAARYFADDPARVMLSVTPAWQLTWQATFLLPSTRTRFTWLGEVWSPMDLTIFGDERYDVIDGAFDAWLQPDPQPGIGWDPASRKPNRSPWYWVTSVRVEQPLGSHLRLFVGADNLLDYRQVVVDSPLHVAVERENNVFDVIGIWGPQRGRLVYGGVTLLW